MPYTCAYFEPVGDVPIDCDGAFRLFGHVLDKSHHDPVYSPGGGGGGVLRFGSDGGVPLKPPNQYLSLRVILAEKGTYY